MNNASAARPRLRAWVATLLTALLVATGVGLGAAPASAAAGDVAGATLNWGIKASFLNYITGPIAHGTVVVDGNVSATPRFSWTAGTGTASPAGATGSVGYGGSIHLSGHAGALDMTFSNVRVTQSSAAAAVLVADVSYVDMAAPGVPVSVSNVTLATVDLAAATVASTPTTVAYTNAPATLTAEGAVAFSGFYTAGTALDPVSFSWPVEQPPAPPVPTVTVSKTTEILPGGELITVTGTGFSPVAPGTTGTRAPLSGKFGGAYVVFGKFADVWQPSAAAPSSARKVGTQAWVMNPEDAATIGSTSVPINADGSFSVQLLVSRGFTGEPATGNYGIYTYSGSGASYAPFETYTPVSFSTAPVISVSKTTDLNPLGETVTVQGWNFSPVAPATTGTRAPLENKFGGTYVVFGKFAEVWQPSVTAPSSARKVSTQAWVMNPEDAATIGSTSVAINADGSFSVQLLASRGFTGEPATGNYGIYTYSGSGAKYAGFETYTPVAFTAAAGTTLALTAAPASGLVVGNTATLTATVSPAAAGTVTFRSGATIIGTASTDAAGRASLATAPLTEGTLALRAEFAPTNPLLFAPATGTLSLVVGPKPVAAGSLTWGVKEAFRSYVAGPIAHGSITTSGVGGSGGSFVFGQAGGGSFTPASGTGSSNYTGSVRFTGHNGVLDLSVANPVVVVESASRATLYLSVNGGGSTPFATLNLAAGIPTSAGNTVGWVGVPASLTMQGASVFSYAGSSFYPAGTALDPVSFVIGSPSSAGGGSRTVAAYVGPKQPAPTPPATTGLTVDPTSLKNLVAGGEVSITAEGFAPNEADLLVVIYSEPIVLARDLKADANGVLTWTGRLPAGLIGEHTLTVQGSVSRGIVLDIPALVQTAAMNGCPVQDATLTWGFKETFRSYISGSIANGEWVVADGASYETPNFGWTDGDGSYEQKTAEGLIGFQGSITFTGHGGILNTTISNPQLRFVDKDTAMLLVDVTGTTQEGAPVDQRGIEFVELDLSAATQTEADGVVTVTGAPAVLTASGAGAFGTYEAKTDFDPVSFSFTLDEACATVEEAPVGTETEQASTSTDLSWLFWLIPLVLLILGAILALVIRSRKRSAN